MYNSVTRGTIHYLTCCWYNIKLVISKSLCHYVTVLLCLVELPIFNILSQFQVILVLGLVIMVLGTYANLQAAENSHDKYDDKYITQEKIDKIVEDFFQSKKLENEGNPILQFICISFFFLKDENS